MRTSPRLHREVQQRSCSGKRCRRNNETVPHCQRSARRHRCKESSPPGSPRTLNEFLAIAKIYIAYEEELYADNLNKSRKEEPVAESSKKPFHEKKKEGRVTREGKRPNGHFTEYTPLAMSREKILAEIAVADLTEAGVKPPKVPSQERKGVNKTKYCRFHKCHGHVTDDSIH